jgi:hypothetical protein
MLTKVFFILVYTLSVIHTIHRIVLVTFFSEQVSHHPPVSAFYAEHPAAGVSFTADIYTKSQFLGLSLGIIFDRCIAILI